MMASIGRQRLRRFTSVPLAKASIYPDVFSLPAQYLRASDASNRDPGTMQRTDIEFDRDTGKPSLRKSKLRGLPMEIVSCALQGDVYHVEWSDGLVSKYSQAWISDSLQMMEGSKKKESTDREYGIGWTEETVRSSLGLQIDFGDAITVTGREASLHSLHKYGILMVTNTPTDDGGGGVAALASAIGGSSIKNNTSLVTHYSQAKVDRNVIGLPHGTDGPLRTLYGTVWSTSTVSHMEGTSRADSAYGHEALPLHTDMTYSRDPPGLQIFTMKQPATSGGESIYCDGFAAAERLRRVNPEAFGILSTTVRRYYCMDEVTGWHLEASGPVISVDTAGRVVMIRHNDLDRMPDLPVGHDLPENDVSKFYDILQSAHLAWDRVLAEDDMRLVLRLEPGETIIVSNQRWLHGRFSFQTSRETPRAIMGCYMGQDELNSRFRILGLYAH